MIKKKLSEEQIDKLVEREAFNEASWEEPIKIKADRSISLRLAPQIIRKAKFFSKVHNAKGYQTWIKNIVEDRLKIEEEIYFAVKSNSNLEKVM